MSLDPSRVVTSVALTLQEALYERTKSKKAVGDLR